MVKPFTYQEQLDCINASKPLLKMQPTEWPTDSYGVQFSIEALSDMNLAEQAKLYMGIAAPLILANEKLIKGNDPVDLDKALKDHVTITQEGKCVMRLRTDDSPSWEIFVDKMHKALTQVAADCTRREQARLGYSVCYVAANQEPVHHVSAHKTVSSSELRAQKKNERRQQWKEELDGKQQKIAASKHAQALIPKPADIAALKPLLQLLEHNSPADRREDAALLAHAVRAIADKLDMRDEATLETAYNGAELTRLKAETAMHRRLAKLLLDPGTLSAAAENIGIERQRPTQAQKIERSRTLAHNLEYLRDTPEAQRFLEGLGIPALPLLLEAAVAETQALPKRLPDGTMPHGPKTFSHAYADSVKELGGSAEEIYQLAPELAQETTSSLLSRHARSRSASL